MRFSTVHHSPSHGLRRPGLLESLQAHAAEIARSLSELWRLVRVFYGIALLAGAALALVASLLLGADLSVAGPTVSRAAATQSVLPESTDRVVYLVGSQRASDNLLAYGAGLPTDSPSRLLPDAHVTVLVADSPESETRARVAIDRLIEAKSPAAWGAVQIVDLR